MRRRLLIAQAAAGLAGAVHLPARAQRAAVARVGFLIAADTEPSWSLFRKAMAGLGYIEGRTVHYEFRSSDADPERLTAHAASLVNANVDVIVAVLTPAIIAASKATTRIPIIFAGGTVDMGLVTNIARPEGNLTGAYGMALLVAGKSIQIFRDLKPSTKAMGLLLNASDPFNVPLRREIEAAGKAQRIDIIAQMVSASQELAPALEALARNGVDGVIVQPSLPIHEAATLATRHNMPSMSYRRQFADVGGLLSYGSNPAELARLIAGYTDKVLKGVPTADLPVQMTTRLELVLNQRTAKAIGLTIPAMFLARADEVIE